MRRQMKSSPLPPTGQRIYQMNTFEFLSISWMRHTISCKEKNYRNNLFLQPTVSFKSRKLSTIKIVVLFFAIAWWMKVEKSVKAL